MRIFPTSLYRLKDRVFISKHIITQIANFVNRFTIFFKGKIKKIKMQNKKPLTGQSRQGRGGA